MRRTICGCLAVLAPLLYPIAVLSIDRQPQQDYRARRVALAQRTGGGVVVVFASTEPEGPNALWAFRQDDNFFYLTGIRDSGAAALVLFASNRMLKK